MSNQVNGPAHRPELAMFGQLRAETEPWLGSCYVPPAEFPLLIGAQSTLIFGESGSGKTALKMALTRTWMQPSENSLVVEWPIHTLVSDQSILSGSPLAVAQQLQVYSAVARTILHQLAQQPDNWYEAPDWVRLTLGWFIHRFLQGDVRSEVTGSIENNPAIIQGMLTSILETDKYRLLPPDAPPILVVGKLSEALKRIGITRIRVVVDNVEPWWEAEPDRLANNLHAFLSTLLLFEHPDFSYFMFLPADLLPRLSRSSAVIRRRAQVVRLQMSEAELTTIVRRRLAFALGKIGFDLKDLGPAHILRTWLVGCGGSSPRGWLETARPFLMAYLGESSAVSDREPLAVSECREVQRLHPPTLWIDPDTRAVVVGWRRLDGLSPGHLAILRHLLDHPAQLCTRRQLYMAYVTAYPESFADPDAKPAEYAGILDSALWRLRTLIEPDPDYPVLLETKKGQGVILKAM